MLTGSGAGERTISYWQPLLSVSDTAPTGRYVVAQLADEGVADLYLGVTMNWLEQLRTDAHGR